MVTITTRPVHKRLIIASLLAVGLLSLTTQEFSLRVLLEGIHQAISSSSSSEYSWLGNQYIPPAGVPIFSPLDYYSVFKQRNTLFMGDSTIRRAYGTLFAIMNSTDYSNVKTEDIDGPDVINFNHFGLDRRRESCLNTDREITTAIQNKPSSYPFPIYVCRDLPELNTSNHTHTNFDDITLVDESTRIAKQNIVGKGRFDFFWSPCIVDTIALFSDEDIIHALQDYDLIVFSLGVWDGHEMAQCAVNEFASKSIEEKVDELINASTRMAYLNSNIIFRTPGFTGSGRGNEVVHYVSKRMKESSNLTIVDWGSVLEHRSFGGERIAGDNDVHYGLEARLLFAQQLLHEILSSSKS